MTLRVGLLVNPTAGGGRGAAAGEAAATELAGLGAQVSKVTGVDAAGALFAARELIGSGAVDVLAVVGGDGMVHLGVQAVAGTSTPLGLVPAGSGNDFARLLGLSPDDVPDSAAVIAAGHARTVDLGCASWGSERRWFAGVMSTGFDSAVNERGNRMRWPKGRRRYDLAMVAELGAFRPREVELVLDGVVLTVEAMLVAVGNGTSYGGGMHIAPGALVDDGLFHITVVHRVSRVELLRVFPRVFRGAHVDHPAVSVHTARVVRVTAPASVAYADGERLGELPVTAECVPGALSVLVA